MDRNTVEEKLRRYKREEKEDMLVMVPICQNGYVTAYLRPLTFDYKSSLPGIVCALSEWRRENSYAWASTFDVTDERTEMWLKKYVLEKKDRIIFVIQDLNNHYIGQIGLAGFDYNEKSVEIDAVVRGKKDVLPGIMGAALNTIINWGELEFHVEKFLLDVFDDNLHAIKFYKKNGFVESGRIALVEQKSRMETRWEIDESIAVESASRCYIKMELEHKEGAKR